MQSSDPFGATIADSFIAPFGLGGLSELVAWETISLRPPRYLNKYLVQQTLLARCNQFPLSYDEA